jgi:hypothetical protein
VSDDPDSWFNRKAAEFCTALKDQVDNTLAPFGHKERIKQWLDEACPQSGDRERTGEDPVTAFNSKLPGIIHHAEFFGRTKVDRRMIT